MAREGGNPVLKDYQYQAAGDEPLTSHLQVKLTASQLKAIKQIPKWQEWVRSLLADALAEGVRGEN